MRGYRKVVKTGEDSVNFCSRLWFLTHPSFSEATVVGLSSLDFNDEPLIECAKGCTHSLVRVRARKQRVMKSRLKKLYSTAFANVKVLGPMINLGAGMFRK